MREIMAITKALADENRTRIVMALGERELCVCQIVELLELAPSTVSKHLSILKQAQLVESRKEGRWMYYRLANRAGPIEAREMTALLFRFLCRDPRIREDAQRLQRILEVDPEELCKRQAQC